MKEAGTHCPASREEWRNWLEKNHGSELSVWLVCYRKHTDMPTVTWSDAVDEALCFGWIDSTRIALDGERFMQFFSRRKPKSGWSKINKEKVRRLIEKDRMTAAGFASIETAQQNGSWTVLDSVEELHVPADLEEAFRLHPGSKARFQGLSRSVQKRLLQGIVLARRPETRQKRITEIAHTSRNGTSVPG